MGAVWGNASPKGTRPRVGLRAVVGSPAMPRRALLALSLLAVAATGCGGGGKQEDAQTRAARKAAEAYVHDLGNRDGEAVCGDVTAPLRKKITDAVVQANPEVAGRSCGEIMTLILRSLPSDQLDQFTTAKIENTRVTGKNGTFVYRLHDIRVDGRVTRAEGPWRVSCCVPGQG